MNWYVLQGAPVFLDRETITALIENGVEIKPLNNHMGTFDPKEPTFKKSDLLPWIATKTSKQKFPDPKKLRLFVSP